jgi:hypothetical protein
LHYWRSYRFLRAFSGSYEDFLNTPVEVVEWLLDMDDMRIGVENEAAKREH